MPELTPAQAAEQRRRLDDDGLTNVILIEPLRFLAGQLVKAILLTAIVRRLTPAKTSRKRRRR